MTVGSRRYGERATASPNCADLNRLAPVPHVARGMPVKADAWQQSSLRVCLSMALTQNALVVTVSTHWRLRVRSLDQAVTTQNRLRFSLFDVATYDLGAYRCRGICRRPVSYTHLTLPTTLQV